MQTGALFLIVMLLQGAGTAACELMDFMALERPAEAPEERVERGLACLAGRLAQIDPALVARAEAVAASGEATLDQVSDRRLRSILGLLRDVAAARPDLRTTLPLFARLDARARFGVGDYCGAVDAYGALKEDFFRRALARAPRNLASLLAMIDHFRDAGRRACNILDDAAAASAALGLYRIDRELSRPQPAERAG